MVARRHLHTFVFSHEPPEWDLLTDAELAGMNVAEAAFIANCYLAGMERVHLRFRKELKRAIRNVVAPEHRLKMQTGLIDGRVVLNLVCDLGADVDPAGISDRIADLLPEVWDGVANANG